MNLAQANLYADKIVPWIGDKTERIEIAGSIRRGFSICNDVDIVCIPKCEIVKDMFGAKLSEQNLVYNFLEKYWVATPGARFISGKDSDKQLIVQLPKCQLDLWFATEKTFATRLLCRTGSKDHNVWLAKRAKRLSMKWNPYEGLLSGGHWIDVPNSDPIYEGGALIQFSTEAAIYAALGLPFIEPQNRELEFLVKNFGQ